MRRIERVELSDGSHAALDRMQQRVSRDSAPAGAAAKLWKRKTGTAPRRRAFTEVRASLQRMSTGRQRCMYCEDSEGTDIDHHRPKSQYPAHAFRWANYLLACSHCNSNEKRSEYPLDPSQKPLLIDPTAEDPYVHVAFVWQTGLFVGLTHRGTRTVQVFGLNRRATLQRGRTHTWTTMAALLNQYRRSQNAAQG